MWVIDTCIFTEICLRIVVQRCSGNKWKKSTARVRRRRSPSTPSAYRPVSRQKPVWKPVAVSSEPIILAEPLSERTTSELLPWTKQENIPVPRNVSRKQLLDVVKKSFRDICKFYAHTLLKNII